jgi:hypothetical protein
MPLMDYAVAIVGGTALVAIVFNLMRKKREAAARAALEQGARLGEIREVQEQIGRLKDTSIKDTESYKIAKEKYDAKYRNRNKPAGTTSDGNDGASGGNNNA